jgi:hypothetical protein
MRAPDAFGRERINPLGCSGPSGRSVPTTGGRSPTIPTAPGYVDSGNPGTLVFRPGSEDDPNQYGGGNEEEDAVEQTERVTDEDDDDGDEDDEDES